MSEKQKSLFFLVLCEVMTLALWFSASATIPDLRQEFTLSDTQASLFTSMVSVGFVCGTLFSAIFGLADRLEPHRFFMGAAFLGAVFNAAILLVDPSTPVVLIFRFLTGAIMAGVYPVGLKMQVFGSMCPLLLLWAVVRLAAWRAAGNGPSPRSLSAPSLVSGRWGV